MNYDTQEWYRAHQAKNFSVKIGKDVEFDVFVRLCIPSGASLDKLGAMAQRAHEICEMGVLANYLTAT